MYQVFLFLQDHLHFFLYFFFSFMGQLFMDDPISTKKWLRSQVRRWNLYETYFSAGNGSIHLRFWRFFQRGSLTNTYTFFVITLSFMCQPPRLLNRISNVLNSHLRDILVVRNAVETPCHAQWVESLGNRRVPWHWHKPLSHELRGERVSERANEWA